MISRHLRKELTVLFKGFSGKRRFLVKFQDGGDKDITLNQLTINTAKRIPMNKRDHYLFDTG